MLQSSENSFNQKSGSPASNPNSYNPVKTVTAPVDQATIGRTLVIKGEISGSEALYIDGRIEGKITMPDSRVTIGRNGKVDASIQAREVVVMGKVRATSSAATASISAPKAPSPATSPPCASAWKMAPRSRAESRSAAKASRTSSKPEAGGPQGPGRDRQRVIGRKILGKNEGHARACPSLSVRAAKLYNASGSTPACTYMTGTY